MKKTKDVFDEAAQLAFIGMVGRNDLAVTLGVATYQLLLAQLPIDRLAIRAQLAQMRFPLEDFPRLDAYNVKQALDFLDAFESAEEKP